MSLPVIQHPIFEVQLKSLEKKVRFRPFLVKEEKILLIAKESEDYETMIKAIKQILTNCCVDGIDVDTLPLFDLQMLFVHLRMKSISEAVSLEYVCKKPNDEGEVCNHRNQYEMNLDKVCYKTAEGHTDTIMLSDKLGIKMKYPVLTNVNIESDEILQESTNLIIRHIDYIFDDEQIYTRTDFTNEQLGEFIDNLTPDQLNELMKFFVTTPKVVMEDSVNCVRCGKPHNIYAEDLYSFFI